MRTDVIVCRNTISTRSADDAWELEIRESVRQTLADYTAATDRFDLRALAACFASGRCARVHRWCRTVDWSRGDRGRTGWLRWGPRGPVGKGPTPTHVRHHVSSIRFGSVARDRVEVSSYFAVHTDVGLDHWGRYRDELIPVDERWLFARRRISVDAFSPDSLMAG